jgi:hypothetical protein
MGFLAKSFFGFGFWVQAGVSTKVGAAVARGS